PAQPARARPRERNPIPFGGAAGPLRLFGHGLGDQGGWIIPFALFGMLALPLVGFGGGGWSRRDPRLAGTLILGGWFLLEAVLLSVSKGIVHPYYVSALAPGAAAMTGAGAVAIAQLAMRRPRDWRIALGPLAIAATVAAQLTLLHREHYLQWFVPVLLAGAGVAALGALAHRRLAAPAMALSLCLLLVAPTAYSSTTWLAPVEGTFPAAGPSHAVGQGGVGVNARNLGIDRALLDYVIAHRPGTRWAVLTDAADTAAPMILLGFEAGSLGGFSGTDPSLDGRGLARLVARGLARYVVLGGEFSSRGGNRATVAVERACRQLPFTVWHGPHPYPHSLTLYDCAGREAELGAA
ncbi:MAG: hypothetical protein M3Z95_05510, partial [Actinomycetota bacterium]|nr:hypothetical protein [Actinomycetota bacterium]